jgi:tetratricopeptide (TPR) repeat protein
MSGNVAMSLRQLFMFSAFSLAMLSPAAGYAASAADWKACESGDKIIPACSKIIGNRAESVTDRAKALMRRAWGHRFKDEFDAAYADAGEAIKLDAASAAGNYDTRAYMMANADRADLTDRAIADYTASIGLEPTGYRYTSRGDLYHRKGDEAAAQADYRDSVARYSLELAAHPESQWYWRGRSDAYRNLGEIDNALNDFGEFLKRKKDSDDPRVSDRADLYLRKGEFDRAIADYTAAIQKEPDNSDRYDRRALAYRLKGDYKNAILDYDQMVKMDNDNPETYIGRGLAYAGAGKPERAAVDFTKAIDLYDEDATAFYNRAQAEREGGHADLAITDYGAAIQRDPTYAVAFNSRGRAYLQQNDAAHALADFNDALRLDDKFAAAYCNRGFLYQAAGRSREAIEDFGKAIALDPANKDFLIARGSALAAGGSFAEAENDFTAALLVDPLAAPAYVGRAAARLKLEAPQKALDDANRALIVNDALVPAYRVRADVFDALGQADKAAADRAAADTAQTQQDKDRRAVEALHAHPRVRLTMAGNFPVVPAYLKPFKLDTVVEIRDDEIVYRTPGLPAFKLLSGDKYEEKFPGICNGKPGADIGTRTVTSAVDKYLVYVDLQSRVDFTLGACRGRYNAYKESFLIDFSDGTCKFTYRQDRDLFGVGAFDNKIEAQPCVAETLK